MGSKKETQKEINNRAILLTGSSGGVGFEVTKKYIENGFHVFGLDIKEPKEYLDGLSFIKTDLTKEDEVKNAFKIVSESGYQIEHIICTAGMNDMNSLIEISEEDFIKIFDTNAFSVYRTNKYFVPILKERGKVIIISSELGPLDPLPFNGIYTITKALVEKYAYSLRMELQLLGHQVVLIRPGAIDTDMIQVSSERLENFVDNTEQYKDISKKFKNIVDSVQNRKIPPYKVAKLIYKVSQKKKPKYVYRINRNAGLLLLNALPDRMQNWIIKKILTK